MKKATDHVSVGARSVDEALTSFNEIPTLVASVETGLGEIARISEKNVASSEEVSASIEEIQSSMDQISTNASEMANNSTKLTEIATKLVEL